MLSQISISTTNLQPNKKVSYEKRTNKPDKNQRQGYRSYTRYIVLINFKIPQLLTDGPTDVWTDGQTDKVDTTQSPITTCGVITINLVVLINNVLVLNASLFSDKRRERVWQESLAVSSLVLGAICIVCAIVGMNANNIKPCIKAFFLMGCFEGFVVRIEDFNLLL